MAIGSELLGTDRLDTNSLYVTAELERFGVELIEKRVVADDEAAIGRALRDLATEADIVVVSGGLGPTSDDVTREGAALAFGRPLHVDEEIVESIRRRFQRRGETMPEINRRQAEVPEGAEVIANPRGTAPGLVLRPAAGGLVLLLPGVPVELQGMVSSTLVPWLEEHGADGGVVRAVVRIACAHESAIEEQMAPIYAEFGRAGISTLAGGGEIRIQIKRTDPRPVAARVAERFGDRAFGRSEDESLEAVVGGLLIDAGTTISVAESCTGGLLAERLTRVAGSSRYFEGGIVAYSNRLKESALDVPAELIARHGAVSPPVAEAMAAGVRRRLDSGWGVGITGVAGPGGGSAEKPVGTVEVAIAGPESGQARSLALAGDRERVRWMSTQWVLELTRRLLLGREIE